MTLNNLSQTQRGPHYKWIALSNTTLTAFMASLSGSSIMLALPVIFRGIQLNPLAPGSFNYLLWLMMGYMVVVAVLVVTFGRLGDMFGRTRMYNLGFAIFTVGSALCAITWSTGSAGAIELIIFRLVQGVGGAFLFANSAAIITDAFPANQRGMALGINQVAGIAGSFLGILVGGLLSQIGWRWVFLVNVPIGVVGTVWSYLSLKEQGSKKRETIDWLGTISFAAGLTMLLIGITYGINPHGASSMSWTTPFVMGMIAGGIVLLVAFAVIEGRVKMPMFRLSLFRIRAFAAGNAGVFLSAVARGGLMFMLAIWLQGIWLPLHGYDFTETPLWAGIYMLPMSLGFMLAGPFFGRLSDRFGARYFATGGMVLAAATFGLLVFLPVNFRYILFAMLILFNGIGMGMFAAPNTAAIMNSVPPENRGASSGMAATLQNMGMPLSIGIFFSLMIVGMAASVPSAMLAGLTQQGIPTQVAQQLASAPPTGYLFAAFLGYNPLGTLIPASVLSTQSAAQAATVTSRAFFPQLIAGAFHAGLSKVMTFSAVMCLIAAAASWLRGGKYVHGDEIRKR
jgi:EmrB/QacA subfamily drug resistance transporter